MPRGFSRKEKVPESEQSSVSPLSSSTESLDLLPRCKTYNRNQKAMDHRNRKPTYHCELIKQEKEPNKYSENKNDLSICDNSLKCKGRVSEEPDNDWRKQNIIYNKRLEPTLKKIKKFSKRSKVTFSSEILVDELNYNENQVHGAGDSNNKNGPATCSPILGSQLPRTVSIEHQSNGIHCDSQNNCFPFQNTPSGNLKVGPNQVVFNNKDLSLIAANPERTKVTIKINPNDNRNSVNITQLIRTDCAKEFISDNEKAAANSSSDGNLCSSESRTEIQRTEHTDKKNSLAREMSLTKMGFEKNVEIDWDLVKLPQKTDLHTLIQHRLINHIKPLITTHEVQWILKPHMMMEAMDFETCQQNAEIIFMCPDVVVKIGRHDFHCHLIVLQCYASYFNNNPLSNYNIKEEYVSKDAFSCIYDWMLSIKPDSYKMLRRDNVLEIFNGAHYFGIKELEEQCWAFIDNEDLFNEEKAFMLYLDARKYGNNFIMELMVPRIRVFFLVLVSSKEYLELLCGEVCTFLNSNYICVHSETEVFMSGVRWLLHDWENRKHNAVDIMKCIRFGLIPPWQLVDIRRNPDSYEFNLVTQREEVTKLIEDGLAFAIVKYWYGHNEKEYVQWLQLLGLSEPAMRNWIYSDKNYKPYVLYSEFLNSLANYQRTQKKNNKLNKDKKKGTTDSGNHKERYDNELPNMPIADCHHSTKKSNFPFPEENIHQNLDNFQYDVHDFHINCQKKLLNFPLCHCTPQLEMKERELLMRMMEVEKKCGKKMIGKKKSDGSQCEQFNENNKYAIPVPATDLKWKVKAAIIIQRYFRGYKARKQYRLLKSHFKESRSSISNNSKQKKTFINFGKKKHTHCPFSSNSIKPSVSSDSVSYTITSVSTHLEKQSLYMKDKEAILVFGGIDPNTNFGVGSNTGKNIFRYHVGHNTWHFVGEMPIARHNHSVTFLLGTVFIAGGSDPYSTRIKNEVSSEVWTFNPSDQTWQRAPDMIHCRKNFGLVGFKGKLFAVGGTDDDNNTLSSVEQFDAQTGIWTEVKGLLIPRSGLAATRYRDFIWVAGGITDNKKLSMTSTVECYDPRMNLWFSGVNLRYRRCFGSLFTTNEDLYLVGGIGKKLDYQSTSSLSSIDIWDPYRQKWCLHTEMAVPRHGHTVCYMGSQMVIIGGLTTKYMSALNNIECWCVERGVWVRGFSHLPLTLSGLGSVTLPPASLL